MNTNIVNVVQDIKKYYRPYFAEIEAFKVTLEKCVKEPSTYRHTTILDFWLKIDTVIKHAQEHVLICRGVLAVYEGNDSNELEDFKSYIENNGLTSAKITGQIMKEHHINLIDLLECRETLHDLTKVIMEGRKGIEQKLADGWANPETGCRSTYHKTMGDLIEAVRVQIGRGVFWIGADIAYNQGKEMIRFEQEDADPNRILEIMSHLASRNNIARFVLQIFHDDPVHDRVLEIKNDPDGLLNFTIDRLVWSVSQRLLRRISTVVFDLKDFKVVPEEQRSLVRAYLKAHLNLITLNRRHKESLTDYRRYILPAYDHLGRDPDYKGMMKFDAGSGLKDPIFIITKIHLRYGRLINKNGKVFFTKEG